MSLKKMILKKKSEVVCIDIEHIKKNVQRVKKARNMYGGRYQ